MTMSNGTVKNIDNSNNTAVNFDIYSGDFSCDDDISFENLLQLDHDIDRDHDGKTSGGVQLLGHPTVSPVCLPAAIVGTGGLVQSPASETVVYLLTPAGALRPPGIISTYGAPRNDVRPLLRFQIAKRPLPTSLACSTVVPLIAENQLSGLRSTMTGTSATTLTLMAAPSRCLTVASIPANISTATGPITSLPADTDASVGTATVAGNEPPAKLITAVNGELSLPLSATSHRPSNNSKLSKPVTSVPGATSGNNKSRSAAAADARQTVQEKNAYEYERVMDILRYYKELVVERKLPGACLPCKRRKSKPLVSAGDIASSTSGSKPAQPMALPTSSEMPPRPSVNAGGWIHVQTKSSAALQSLASSLIPVQPQMLKFSLTGSKANEHQRPGSTLSVPHTVPYSVTTMTTWSAQVTTSVSAEKPQGTGIEINDSLKDATALQLPDQKSTLQKRGISKSSQKGTIEVSQRRRHLSQTVPDTGTQQHDDTMSCLTLRRSRSASELNNKFRSPDCEASVRLAFGFGVGDDVLDSRRTKSDCKITEQSVSQRMHDETWQVTANGKIIETERKANGMTRKRHYEDDAADDFDVLKMPVDGITNVPEVQILPVKQASTPTTNSILIKWTKSHLAVSGPYQSWT